MPPPEADDRNNPLLLKLRERIRRDGPLSVDGFMQACIGDAEHGYWRRRDTIGAVERRGDRVGFAASDCLAALELIEIGASHDD